MAAISASPTLIDNIWHAIFHDLKYTLLVTVLVLYALNRSFDYFKNAGRRLPPLVRGWPAVGVLPRMVSDPDKLFRELGRKHGNIFRVNMGIEEFVVLNDFEAIREAMMQKNADIFSGRQQTFNMIKYLMHDKGIVVEDGEDWREQRRFALGALRDLGFGNSKMESSVLQECQSVVDIMEAQKGKPFNYSAALANAVSNVICALTFGKNFDYSDPTFVRARDYTWKFERIIANPYLTFYPFLRLLPRWLNGIAKIDVVMDELYSFIGDIIKVHEDSYDENKLRDYLDMTLQASHAKRQKNPTNLGTFDIDHLKINLFTFFFAGMTTTVRTVEWGIKFLSAHPEVQAEVQREMDAVVGRERLPSWADRSRMPKMESFIYETQRCSDVVPLALPHTNLSEVNVLGYDIPKRSIILTNLRAVHQDPKLWKDPQNFRPNRFLDRDGKVFKPDYLIPFGVGKRICLGESLARMELFLFFTTMVQRFTFLPASDAASIDNFEIEVSPVQRALKPFNIRAQPREK